MQYHSKTSNMTDHSNILLDQNEFDIILEFEKKLEHIFSSETRVVIFPSENNITRLAIEIESNFSLSEIISLLKMPFGGENRAASLSKTILLFQNTMFGLHKSLAVTIDIEEISLYFKNTSITIQSIHRNSIMEELEYIIKAVIHHYQYYSTIMGQLPNEIHIPVIEDNTTKELLNKNHSIKPINLKSPYSRFWGLYFDAINEPIIYNLDRTNITPGDLDIYID